VVYYSLGRELFGDAGPASVISRKKLAKILIIEPGLQLRQWLPQSPFLQTDIVSASSCLSYHLSIFISNTRSTVYLEVSLA